MIRRTIFWIFAAIAFWVMVIMPVMAIILYNEPPPISNVVRTVLTKEVLPGGELKVRIQAEVREQCTATIYRFIIDGVGIVQTYAPIERPQVQADTIISVTVPVGAAPGEAHYRTKTEWHCNIIQQWFPYVLVRPDLDFTILPPPEEKQGMLPSYVTVTTGIN